GMWISAGTSSGPVWVMESGVRAMARLAWFFLAVPPGTWLRIAVRAVRRFPICTVIVVMVCDSFGVARVRLTFTTIACCVMIAQLMAHRYRPPQQKSPPGTHLAGI